MNAPITADVIKNIILNSPDYCESRYVLKLCVSSVQQLLTELQDETNRFKPNYIELGKKADKLHSAAFSLCRAIHLATSMANLQDLVIEQSVTPTGAPLHRSDDDDTPFPS